MADSKDFYTRYDELIPLICEPYIKFLELGAASIPFTTRSICDVGIGTGNFSLAVRRRIPHVSIRGVDFNTSFAGIARKKLGKVTIEEKDAFNGPLPPAEYVITSLTLHHLANEDRDFKLLRLLNGKKGLVNMDIALWNGKTKQDAITAILGFAKKHFAPEDMKNIAYEIETKDNPMELDEQKNFLSHKDLPLPCWRRAFLLLCTTFTAEQEDVFLFNNSLDFRNVRDMRIMCCVEYVHMRVL